MPNPNDLLATGWQLHQQGELAKAELIYRQVLSVAVEEPNA